METKTVKPNVFHAGSHMEFVLPAMTPCKAVRVVRTRAKHHNLLVSIDVDAATMERLNIWTPRDDGSGGFLVPLVTLDLTEEQAMAAHAATWDREHSK